MDNKEGYLLCVFEKEIYLRMAKRMIKVIRKYDKQRKICILTDMPEIKYDEDIDVPGIFAIIFDSNNHSHPLIDMSVSWNRNALIPKIYQSFYSPFEKTCFMDVDMVLASDFTFIWEDFSKANLPIMIAGKSDSENNSPSDWHWGHINDVKTHCGFNIPQIWSTWFLYDKRLPDLIQKENMLSRILDNHKIWKVRVEFRGGLPDEIVYSLILGMMKIHPSEKMHKWLENPNNCKDPHDRFGSEEYIL